MATDPYDDILKRVLSDLSDEDRIRLIQELAKRDTSDINGGQHPKAQFGTGKDLLQVHEDFDAPLKDFEDYMG